MVPQPFHISSQTRLTANGLTERHSPRLFVGRGRNASKHADIIVSSAGRDEDTIRTRLRPLKG